MPGAPPNLLRAEFERGLLLERQREGVAKARADAKYKGRKPTARAKSAEVIRLDVEGLKRTEIARRTGMESRRCIAPWPRRKAGCWSNDTDINPGHATPLRRLVSYPGQERHHAVPIHFW